jgi:hypothetical protein
MGVHKVTIVVQCADAFNFAPGKAFINGLKAVKGKLGGEVHFVHVHLVLVLIFYLQLSPLATRPLEQSSFRPMQVSISF